MSERLAGTYRHGSFTEAHVNALSILSEHGVLYRAEEVVRIYGEFDGMGREVAYKVDILVTDPRYGHGVIEIDGLYHHRGDNPAKTGLRDARLKKLGLWVVHIENADIGRVMDVLEEHRRDVN